MIPYRSSSEKENCSPQSSNCVIWQGPDLSCINLCKGDSISDVTYKLAVELCKIKDATDLTDLDLSCVLDLCDNTPQPALTTAAVLQVIIDGLCCSGLAKRVREEDDKRQVYGVLTEKGEKLVRGLG